MVSVYDFINILINKDSIVTLKDVVTNETLASFKSYQFVYTELRDWLVAAFKCDTLYGSSSICEYTLYVSNGINQSV